VASGRIQRKRGDPAKESRASALLHLQSQEVSKKVYGASSKIIMTALETLLLDMWEADESIQQRVSK
jgi:hypothetical protein